MSIENTRQNEVLNVNINNENELFSEYDDEENADGICINSKILASIAHRQEEYQNKMRTIAETQSKQQTSILSAIKGFLLSSFRSKMLLIKHYIKFKV